MSNMINTSSNAVKLDNNIQSNNNILNFPNKKNRTSKKGNTTGGSKKKRKVTEVDAFTLEETIKISNILSKKENPRDYTIFLLGINTALRCGDILNLEWQDILNEHSGNIENGITLYEEKTEGHNKKRHIEFNSTVIDALESYYLYEYYQTNSVPSGYLFKSEKNNKSDRINLTVESVCKMLQKVSLECGITHRVGSHSMRKAFGRQFMVEADKRGIHLAIYQLQELLCHSSPKITMVYIGKQKEIEREMYEMVQLGVSSSQ